MFWKWLPPPWTQAKLLTLRRGITPMGAIKTDLRTPQETVQKIGEPKSPVPESLSADLGIADLEITNYGQNIQYTGKGLETNVGERVDSPTKGLSVPSKGIGHAYAREIYPARSISRTAMAKEAPSRKAVVPKMQGISRPEITKRTKEMEEGIYEEPEPSDGLGTFIDETPEFWNRFNNPVINRPRMSKRLPNRRGRRDESHLQIMGGIRL